MEASSSSYLLCLLILLLIRLLSLRLPPPLAPIPSPSSLPSPLHPPPSLPHLPYPYIIYFRSFFSWHQRSSLLFSSSVLFCSLLFSSLLFSTEDLMTNRCTASLSGAHVARGNACQPPALLPASAPTPPPHLPCPLLLPGRVWGWGGGDRGEEEEEEERRQEERRGCHGNRRGESAA